MRDTIYRLGRALNARRAEAELDRLPDYLLKDMGIARCEIHQMVRKGGRDPG